MKFTASLFLSLIAAAGILSATPIQTVSADVVNAGTKLVDSNGYYVGPYTLNVNGTNYAALCVDFQDVATLGQTYSAYESQLNGSLADTYHPTWSTQYKEEAYLMSLILQPGADRIDIQHAAWAITDSSYHANSAAQAFINLAVANYSTLDLSKFDIISGTSQGCNRAQEFIIDPSANVATPEPASMLLMGGGLAIAGLLRRKSKKA